MNRFAMAALALSAALFGLCSNAEARHWGQYSWDNVTYAHDMTVLMQMRQSGFVKVYKGWQQSLEQDIKDYEARGATRAEAEAAFTDRLKRAEALIKSGFREPVDISPKLDRLDNRLYLVDNIAKLGHGRVSSLFTALDMGTKAAYKGCLCAGGFAMGVGGGYHPKPAGDCQNDLPCKGGNWGCVAFELPDKARVWTLCDAKGDEPVIGEVLRATLKRAFTKADKRLSAEEQAKLTRKRKCELAVTLIAMKVRGNLTRSELEGWTALCEGLQEDDEPIFRYGNWYGPGYWGGYEHPTMAGPKAPVDSLDEVAMRHDFGYLLAEITGRTYAALYGEEYGKSVEHQLRGIADAIAVRDSKRLPHDPALWPNPPKTPEGIEKAKRYRARIITGFTYEAQAYGVASGYEYTAASGFTLESAMAAYKSTTLPLPPGAAGMKTFENAVDTLVQDWKAHGEGKNTAFFEAYTAEQARLLKLKKEQEALAKKEQQRKQAIEDSKRIRLPTDPANPTDLVNPPVVPPMK